MGYPDVAASEIYKSKAITSQVRAAVELDYPVFTSPFDDQFPGAALDTAKWFSNIPSWGVVTVAGSTVRLSVTGTAISPPYLQSRHNLAFPLSRETDWTFETRLRFPVITGFGVGMLICGRSFRDAESVWGLWVDMADGMRGSIPHGYAGEVDRWNHIISNGWMRHRISYDATLAQYAYSVDENDDGVYEWGPVHVAVDGRYADAVTIGNSTAIQGWLGAWTEIEVDYVTITGTSETVADPSWAAPFTYDGTRFSYLPTMVGGRVNVDKDNQVDAAEIELDNFSLADDGSEQPQTYTWMRFLNRRAIIEARAGDGNGHWVPWGVLFDGLCAEKQVRLQEGGRCSLSVPLRDRWRARADDMQILACYSDAGAVIPGVGMNLTVQQIIQDIYQNKCGLAAASHNVVATPNSTPRNLNIFRQGAQEAVANLADQTALAIYQRVSDARIEIQDWFWGTDAPGYNLSTAEELLTVEWTESAFDVTSAEQVNFENCEFADGGFTHQWPPHAEPWYGRKTYSNAVTVKSDVDHDAHPLAALWWWARNRKLGSIQATAIAQLWLEHNLEVNVRDHRFLGLEGETWIVDGWEHNWGEGGLITTRIRLIYPHPDRFLRSNLMP